MSEHGHDLRLRDPMSGTELAFVEGEFDGEADFWFEAAEEGTSWGAPVSVTRIVTSLLSDGDLVVHDRDGNRELSVPLILCGTSATALADGEAELDRMAGHPLELIWTPPDEYDVPPTVFSVLHFDFTVAFDGVWEVLRKQRRVAVSMVCEPHAMSLYPVTVEPLESNGGSKVLVDDCSSDAGWTGDIVDAGSYLRLLVSGPTNTAIRTAPIDMSTKAYLTLTTGGSYTIGYPLVAVGGVFLEQVDVSMVPGNRLEQTFARPATHPTLSGELQIITPYVSVGFSTTRLYRIELSGDAPGTSLRQVSRTLPVGGTRRPPGSLEISAPIGYLGLTMVHTSPHDGYGYSPSLRKHRTAGNTVSDDADTFSGKRELLHPAFFQSDIPAANLPPDGYTLLGVVASGTTATVILRWEIITYVNGGATIASTSEGSGAFALTANVWSLVRFPELLTLPPVAVQEGSDAFVRIKLLRDESTPHTVSIDDAFLSREGAGCALTIVDASESTRLWIDSPSVGVPSPRVWVGDAEDKSDAYHPGLDVQALGVHMFSPPQTKVAVWARGTDLPAVRYVFRERWHTHAATLGTPPEEV